MSDEHLTLKRFLHFLSQETLWEMLLLKKRKRKVCMSYINSVARLYGCINKWQRRRFLRNNLSFERDIESLIYFNCEHLLEASFFSRARTFEFRMDEVANLTSNLLIKWRCVTEMYSFFYTRITCSALNIKRRTTSDFTHNVIRIWEKPISLVKSLEVYCYTIFHNIDEDAGLNWR